MKSDFEIAGEIRALLEPLSPTQRDNILRWVSESLIDVPKAVVKTTPPVKAVSAPDEVEEDTKPINKVKKRRRKVGPLRDQSINEVSTAVLLTFIDKRGSVSELSATDIADKIKEFKGLPNWVYGRYAYTRVGREMGKLERLGLVEKRGLFHWGLTSKGLEELGSKRDDNNPFGKSTKPTNVRSIAATH